MSARRSRSPFPRCMECGRPVLPVEPQHRWDTMTESIDLVHDPDLVTYVRHAACQERVEAEVEESRRC